MRDRERSPNEPERPAEEALDRRLREALEPPPSVAGRIARRAMAEEPQPRRPLVVRPAIAVAGLAIAAVALAALLVLPRLARVEPEGAPAATARYSITNRGEVLVVQALDGGPSSLHSTRPLPERTQSPPGMKIIVLGGTRP